MNNRIQMRAETYKKSHSRRKWLYRVLSVGAAITIFCTTYALILPAITMTKDPLCGMKEHTHTAQCYAKTAESALLACTADGHLLLAEDVDRVVHSHNAFCYDATGVLRCTLAELAVHTHDDSCYAFVTLDAEKAPETETPVTKAPETEASETEVPETEASETEVPETEVPETEVPETEVPETEVPETEASETDASETEASETAVPETEAPETEVPETEAPETEASETEAPEVKEKRVLVCGREEIVLHLHDDGCLDDEGDFVCGEMQVIEHNHTAECVPAKTAEGELKPICGLVEHTHDEVRCYTANASDTETKKIWEATLPAERIGRWAADLCEVALSQLGYSESESNVQVSASGIISRYSRYGAWYGHPYAEWNTMFTAFCMHYAGIPKAEIPYAQDADAWLAVLSEEKLLSEDPEYKFAAGDIVFVSDGEQTITGIVSEYDPEIGEGTVVAGDIDGTVEEISFTDENQTVVGYIKISELYEKYAIRKGLILTNDLDSIAEPAYGSAWQRLVDSGYFDFLTETDFAETTTAASVEVNEGTGEQITDMRAADQSFSLFMLGSYEKTEDQIDDEGGENYSEDGRVAVSKRIEATELENVFDITLGVRTSQNVSEYYIEPDMAVVIVMDISNTMRSQFGDSTRYEAAMAAAESFIDEFAKEQNSVSRVGFVAFNTHATKIFDFSPCATTAQATALKNQMKTGTGAIINASDYSTSKSRYTNVEAGLATAADMLKDMPQENKYVIFLSDGFPTTYLQNRDTSTTLGYEPYSSSGTSGKDGVFYDVPLKKYCRYGVSYSDKAAIRAREEATDMKENGGIKIFSVGVDIGGQLISTYVTQSQNGDGFSVVDRTGTNYEIGSAYDKDAYKAWLQNKIGSGEGYYFDSENSSQLTDAFRQIFEQIKLINGNSSKLIWTTADPIPVFTSELNTVEFIGFYDKDGTLLATEEDPHGASVEGGENTAHYENEEHTILWDLKQSGYISIAQNEITYYTMMLKYRVRLRNEDSHFAEGESYFTNDTTTLTYQLIDVDGDTTTVHDPQTIDYPLPQVHGFLAELEFKKNGPFDEAVPGAEFTLSHDTNACVDCRGDGTACLTIPNYTAVSDENGIVKFVNIPSGHAYLLTETVVPDGYYATKNTYAVLVQYDIITVTETAPDGTSKTWETDGDHVIVNLAAYRLPETGGQGTMLYTVSGVLCMLLPLVISVYRRRKKEY